MKRTIILFSVLILILSSCKHAPSKNCEIVLLKNLYSYYQPVSIHPICLDSVNSILSIGTYLDSICSLHPNKLDQMVGIVYNLKDSFFIPSEDSINNIVIPCGKGNPSHGRLVFSPYCSLISSISGDSLTFFDEETKTQTRVKITCFENFFYEYLQKNNIKNLPSDEYVAVSVDISNNPPKESFEKIFETLFWSYYSEVLKPIKANPNIDLADLAKSQKDPSVIGNIMNPILIKLIRYNPEYDFRYQVLTPKRLQ